MSSVSGKTIVLVHGAWRGGWVFRRVARILRSRGHEVFTPTLTGLGERSHLAALPINLSTHIRDILNVIAFEDLSDVVLCGHSYGGHIVTAVADRMPERIASLVYLDAYVGEDGKSNLDLDTPEAAAFCLELAKSNDGVAMLPMSAERFGVNPADREWVDAMCTPQPLATFTERLRLAGAHERVARRTYVYAEGWSGSPFGPIYERLNNDPRWRCHRLPCGHDLMIDMPVETADVIEASA